MTKRFAGRHVLVTGGARGIGLGIAQAFGREGAQLTLFDVHRDNLDAARASVTTSGAGPRRSPAGWCR